MKTFIASFLGNQNPQTYRQFVEFQQTLRDIKDFIAAETVSGRIDPVQEVTNDNQELSPPMAGKLLKWRYLCNVNLDVRGISGPGWLQLEAYITGGGLVYQSPVWNCDNSRSVAASFYVNGPGSVYFEVKGRFATIQGGGFNLHAVSTVL